MGCCSEGLLATRMYCSLQALTPLTIGRSSFKATLLGALWGFGHSIGQLILGLLMVILKVWLLQAVMLSFALPWLLA